MPSPYASGGSFANYSGSITTGGTSQQQIALNGARRYLIIQNVSAGDLWVDFETPAVLDQPSIRLVPGASAEWSAGGTGFVPVGALHIIGATTGQLFVAKEG